ncbi:hypothetical protein [Haloarchaeobius sp. DYHT-AS-18]|uniref:hypothetical protein n=1 Tax=Haloarchaeobius sp. DYHT-AS-18 TaxID=3446117 RepID=UPI003EBB0354
MTRLAALLVAVVDALPFAVLLGAVTYFGGQSSLGATRAGAMAGVVTVASVLLFGLVSYAKYRGSGERFWLGKMTIELLWLVGQ